MIQSPFLRSLFNIVNILMLVSCVLAGLLSAWWLFPIGVLLWLVMVIILAREPTTVLNESIERRPALTQRFDLPFNRIVRIQVSIFNTNRSLPGAWQRALQPLQDELGFLVDEIYHLCERMSPLENLMAISNVTDAHLEDEIKAIQAKLNASSDAKTRKEYEDSLASMQQRLNQKQDTDRTLQRLDAELLSLVNELTTLQGEVIRLRSGASKPPAEKIDTLVAEIRMMILDVKNFQ